MGQCAYYHEQWSLGKNASTVQSFSLKAQQETQSNNMQGRAISRQIISGLDRITKLRKQNTDQNQQVNGGRYNGSANSDTVGKK